VLFLSSWYPNRTNDTLGNFVEKHINSVSKFVNSYSLAFFSDKNCKKIEICIIQKEHYHEIVVYFPKAPQIFLLKQIFSLFYYIKAILKGFSYLKKNNFTFQLIHVHVAFPISIIALYFKNFKKIPYIITEHSTCYSKELSTISFVQKCIAKRAFRKADLILPVSQNLANAIHFFSQAENFMIIPNVVDVNLFEKKSVNLSQNIIFIHISTANDKQKNLSGIIEVFAELIKENQHIFLKILSDGPLKQFKKLALDLDIKSNNIQFIGKSTTSEVAQHLKESDALVLFSNYENFPCVIPESFAVGIPVISSNVNGIPEYVNDENGILIQAKNKNELKMAILSLVNKEKQFDSQRLRDYAIQEFSYESIGLKLVTIYNKVLHVS
jgi:glycosyltransferase involved in cell wall biosynthesis